MPKQPKSILYIRPDTIGDLVIFSAALRQLCDAWPDATHTLLVRSGYDELAPLFPDKLRWQVTSINPFTQKPSEVRPAFDALVKQIKSLHPDLIVAPTLNRTWLETALSSQFPKARHVSLGQHEVDALFANALKLELGVDATGTFSETVEVDEHRRDWKSNHRLVEQLLGFQLDIRFPTLISTAEARAQADAQLQALGLSRGQYVIVFAGGLANVPIKAWPSSKFGELIAWLQKSQPYPVLVAGHASEADAIGAVAAAAEKQGAAQVRHWLGRDGEILRLAALLEAADFYVGHDTGAMHMAAAFGRPVIGIFGGGHWPRFRPAGPQTISVVQPLPCFGCNWDCIFNDAPCVKSISSEDVQRAISILLARRSEKIDEVVETQHFFPAALGLIETVKRHYRELQDDRVARQHRIEELKTEANAKDAEIARLTATAEERKEAMALIKASLEKECAKRDAVITELKAANDEKERLIVTLHNTAEERRVAIDAIKSAIEADNGTQDTAMLSLRYSAEEKEREIQQLKIVAEERKAAMDSIKSSLEAECAVRDRALENLRKNADEKDREIIALKRVAEERKAAMDSIKVSLEGECAKRDRMIKGLNESLYGVKQAMDAAQKESRQIQLERDAQITALQRAQEEFVKESASFKKISESYAAVADQLKNRLTLLEEQTLSETQRKDELIEAKNRELRACNEELTLFRSKTSGLPADWDIRFKEIHDREVHIQNLENLIAARARDLAAAETSLENYASREGYFEQNKHFNKLLLEKETVIRILNHACVEREKLIKQLALDLAGPPGKIGRLWLLARKHAELKWWIPAKQRFFDWAVEKYWMKIGVLEHYAPRPLRWDRLPKARLPAEKLPKIGIVTPSYGQAAFVESTLLSVLNQKYPKLHYVVQDGGSKDASPQIIERYADRLHYWTSERDKGQADAIRRGFKRLEPILGPDDLMGWLNSDDLIAPRTLRFVAEYFTKHPEVDVVYGHRIIIDGEDRDIGRWVMPRHDPETLEWIDYVPQETLFWRKRAWDKIGGIDPSFQFALDWDLLARFQLAQARVVRLPYFLGCFRVHTQQKTSQQIHTVGDEEMKRIRLRFHGEKHNDFETINRFARKTRLAGALTARLMALGIRR